MILIVDDEQGVRDTIEIILRDDYETVSVGNGLEALEVVKSMPVDLVLMDINLPHMDGFETLRMIREVDGDMGVIVISATDSAQKAVHALRLGAYDYIAKPFETDDLLSTIKRYTDRLRLKREVQFLKEELQSQFGDVDIISKTPGMKRVFELVRKVSLTSSSVLITGESGTGKELIARAIQRLGDRKDKPFVAVNCASVPSELMESELFGYERGAFTGAHTTRIGKFEYADGGTVFFDEVATLPMHLQAKLLRVLQEKSFERVGGNKLINVDIRVVAATNVNLEEAVKKGRFREDLYYRLRVVPVELPPLRERKDDIPVLAEYFLERHCKKCKKNVRGITHPALAALTEYPWPGNVRELENLIERLVVLAKGGGEITYEDIPVEIVCSDGENLRSAYEIEDFRRACRVFERHFIIGILNKTNWNRAAAAGIMKIHRNTLLNKMKELGLDVLDGQHSAHDGGEDREHVPVKIGKR
ncbi:MAG: sigma-54-dependent Fis family transcriptional regulator [Deltaproteobacteria bacterium]|nr:sigma-54-dependent Fis family transcriptional regulator [Deltaproteobacteria bacterium]